MKKNLKVFLMCLMFITGTSGIFAQITVRGTVTDTEKQHVVGANVIVKGTTTGTMTGIDGKFSINAPSATSIIVVSFIGYLPQEFIVGDNPVLNVTLQSEATALNEVVVIGYGTVKKRDLTGSVASVTGAQIAAVPVANAAQAMAGKLAGVSVTSQDGRPDASISIRVRGGGSITGSNDPLFIVDGFPVSSISDIPGDQIESIDVLKDASSTAIYGARGANGVIIVTTKGAKSGKLTVNYDGYVQFNEPTKYLETLSAYDYIAYNWGYARAISSGYATAWETLWGIGSQEAAFSNPDGIDAYKDVTARNYSKEAYGSSFSQSHSLNISGGNENTKILFAINYLDNDGMKVNSWYKRTNVTLKIDQQIFKKLNFTLDTRYTNTDRMGSESTTNGRGSILSSSYQFRPIDTEDVLGELNDQINTQIGMYDQVLQDRYNPVARMKDYSPESLNRSLHTNAALAWNVIKGLTARSELGLTSYWNKSYTWSGAVYNDYFDAAGTKTFGGNASITASEGWNLRWVNTLSYDVPGLSNNQTLNIMAGQEVSTSGSNSLTMWGNEFPSNYDASTAFGNMDQYNIFSTSTKHGISSNVGVPNNWLSYFGRANYSLLNRYLLTVTFRADGSSKFAATHRWGYFPAGAIGWRLSEENFLKDVSWLNNLKLRVSYGSVGNDAISALNWRSNWTSDGLTNFSLNEAQQLGYSPTTTIANPDLKWETTITRNAGFDFAFLKSRVYGTFDVYWNSTKDLLVQTAISAISGYSWTYDNIGSTSNKGIELSLGGDIIRKKDLSLSVNFNINFNHGNVDELAPGVNGLYKTNWGSTMTQPNTGDYILLEGQPVGLVRGYTYDGWYTTDDFNYDPVTKIYTLKSGVADIGSGILGTVYGTAANKPAGQSAYPGVLKFKDISGPAGIPDGIVNDYDVSVIGNMNPKHTGGVTINASYKGIDLGLNFNWSYGNQIYNANYLAALYGSKEDGLFRNRLDVLSNSYRIYDIQDGQLVFITDPADLDSLNANANLYLPYQENPICSTLGIEDGSFLRLNTVTLGYTLPRNLSKKAGISKLRLYGSIYNALTITGYSGLDPEVNTNPSQGGAIYPTTGLDWGAYPRARSYTIGLNIEF